jgi:hypothetical protein
MAEMKDRVARPESEKPAAASVARTPAQGAPARKPGPSPAQALALQRTAGNRAAARTLARYVKHPDPEQKGVMVPDISAEEFTRFNPPKNE